MPSLRNWQPKERVPPVSVHKVHDKTVRSTNNHSQISPTIPFTNVERSHTRTGCGAVCSGVAPETSEVRIPFRYCGVPLLYFLCDAMCHVAMQVVRSLRIRSRCLAMRTGKAYDTSAAARSDQRQRQLIYQYELPAEAKNASKSLFFRCAQPEADAVLSTALSRARIHAEESRALAGHFAGSAYIGQASL